MQLKVNDPGWQLQLESSPTAYARLAVDTDGDLAVTVPAGRSVSISGPLSVAGPAAFGAVTMNGALSVTGGSAFAARIQVTGGASPSSGPGLELGYASGIAEVTSYDRTAHVHKELRFDASLLRFWESGSQIGVMDGGVLAWGTAVTPGAGPGDIVLKQTGLLRSVSMAANTTIALLGVGNLTNLDVVNLSPSGGQITTIGAVTVIAGANAGDLLLANGRALRGVNGAGTVTVPLIHAATVGDFPVLGGLGKVVGIGHIAAASLPPASGTYDGAVAIDSTNHRLVFYSGGTRYFVAGTAF